MRRARARGRAITRSSTTARRSSGVFVDLFLDAHAKAPRQIVLDLDATDDPLHGDQEGRFFHGYYDCYCYLPLYVFCGRHLLAAKLRPSNIDGSAGAQEEIARIIPQIRARWPRVRIALRADSGFAREALMAWCEANAVDYVFGLARNARLEARIADALSEARTMSQANGGQPARVFRDFEWSTEGELVTPPPGDRQGRMDGRRGQSSFSRDLAEGRCLARQAALRKARFARAADGEPDQGVPGRSLRRPHLDSHHARQSAAAVVRLDGLCAPVRDAPHRLAHTPFASATCGTIRLKLLKLGALVKISARRVRIAFASACPYAQEWRLAAARLASARASPA